MKQRKHGFSSKEGFALQCESAEKDKFSRTVGTLSIICFAFMLFLFGALVFLLPQESFSENENRVLATTKSLSNANADQFVKKIPSVLSDQFPFRERLASLHASVCLAFVGRANGVRVENRNVLSEEIRADIDSVSYLEESASAINELRFRFEKELNINSVVAICPPPYFIHSPKRSDSQTRTLLYSALRDLEFYDLSSYLNYEKSPYFSTDHHWNADGAYNAYFALCDELGVAPYVSSDFNRLCISEYFYGTTWSKACLPGISPDCFYTYRYEGDDDFRISGDIEHTGLYFSDFLSKKDKYSYFLGGNYGYIRIESSTQSERPTLLLIKDSYANALVPFLARHFDLIMIDPRYFYGDVFEIAKSSDQVLFLFGLTSLMTDIGLVNLTF